MSVVFVKCSKCGADLATVTVEVDGGGMRIDVDPCESCVDDAYLRGAGDYDEEDSWVDEDDDYDDEEDSWTDEEDEDEDDYEA